jgi:uncharacterized protein
MVHYLYKGYNVQTLKRVNVLMDHIIDGHNLIAHTRGLDLSMPDDEPRLVEMLVRYCRKGGHRVEVYFDGAPPGQAGVRGFGRVRAHFVPSGSTADEAIRRRLRALGRAAKNWLLVSSDRAVQAAGREAHAHLLTSAEFAGRLQASLHASAGSAGQAAEEPPSEAEVQEWLEIFKRRSKPN